MSLYAWLLGVFVVCKLISLWCRYMYYATDKRRELNTRVRMIELWLCVWLCTRASMCLHACVWTCPRRQLQRQNPLKTAAISSYICNSISDYIYHYVSTGRAKEGRRPRRRLQPPTPSQTAATPPTAPPPPFPPTSLPPSPQEAHSKN